MIQQPSKSMTLSGIDSTLRDAVWVQDESKSFCLFPDYSGMHEHSLAVISIH